MAVRENISGSKYYNMMDDGHHRSEQDGKELHWKDPIAKNEYWVSTPYTIFDKANGIAFLVRVWEREFPPPPGTEIQPLPDTVQTTDIMAGQDAITQIDVMDAQGNLLGSLGGLSLDPQDFLDGLDEDTPGEQRYAFLVSLRDGDFVSTGSKGDDDGIEVGAGGTATVNSGKGDDLLRVWHDKNVVFNGGKGIDTVNFDAGSGATPAAPAGAVVNLGAGTGTNPFGGTLSFTNVENAAGVFDKANTLIGSGAANQLIGGTGADTIKGMGGDDIIDIGSNDSSPRATDIYGGAGKDTLWAQLSYTDFIGSGFDTRYVNVLDLLNPADNTGTFRGGSFAGLEAYLTRGSDGTVFVFRGSDNSELAAGVNWEDTLVGRGGNDTLRGMGGADTIDGGAGRDVADYSENYFAKIVARINGASTTITVNGVQQDTLVSIEGAKGGQLKDKLTGDAGANEFDGSYGNDVLAGKGGKDHFVFSTQLNSFGNVDTIKDFKHGIDKIDLDDAIFAKLGPTVTSGEFLKVSSGHAAQQGDDRLIYNTTDGTLWFDGDGDGNVAAIKFAVLTGSPDNLNFHDFHIV